jgi:hypothetical protein
VRAATHARTQLEVVGGPATGRRYDDKCRCRNCRRQRAKKAGTGKSRTLALTQPQVSGLLGRLSVASRPQSWRGSALR